MKKIAIENLVGDFFIELVNLSQKLFPRLKHKTVVLRRYIMKFVVTLTKCPKGQSGSSQDGSLLASNKNRPIKKLI